eukprot:gene26573-biopygen16900
MNSCHEEGVRAGREHPPRDSETGHCYSGLDESKLRYQLSPTTYYCTTDAI